MRTKIAQCLIAFTLIVAVDGHWAILQSAAWLGMVVSYSQDAPIAVAVEKTLDGKHPCKLCKLVQEGKAQEKKQDTQKLAPKMDKYLPAIQMVSIQPPKLEPLHSPFIQSLSSRRDCPPVPPPERA